MKVNVRFLSIMLAAQLLISGNLTASAVSSPAAENWGKSFDYAGSALDKNDLGAAEMALGVCLMSTGFSWSKQIFTLELLAELCEKRKDYEAESVILRSMLTRMVEVEFPVHVIGATYLKLGEVSFQLKKYDLAEEYALKAIPLIEECYGSASPEMAVALNNLASAECCEGEYTDATKHFRCSLAILKEIYGQKSELYGMTAVNLAAVFKKAGKMHSSACWYNRAAKILSYARGPQDPDAKEAAHQFSMSTKKTH